jgi:hypothetical protein
VCFAYFAIKSLEIELQLSQIFGLEFIDLELDGDEGLQFPVIEQQVETEVLTADRQQILFADEREVSP